MNVLILGATGGTGLEIVKRAIERNHSVTAFVRSKHALARFNGAVNAVEGNLLDRTDLERVLVGHDAVLSAFGPRDARSHEPLVAPFAQSLVAAMTQCNINRLIILSVAFLFRNSILPPAYPLGQLFLKHHVDDCAEMEAIVRRSRMDWTIVRPPALTNKPRAENYRVGVGRLPFMGFTVSRADVADFMIRAMESGAYGREVVGVAD